MSGIILSDTRLLCWRLTAGVFAAVLMTTCVYAATKPVVKNVRYDVAVADRQLKISADVALWQAKSEPTRLFVPLGTLALESADLDGQPAAVLRTKRDVTGVELMQEAAGDSRLRMTMSTPLHAAGTDRIATFALLSNAAATIRVHVPAGQSLQVDGRELQRPKPKTEPAVYEFATGNRRQISLRLTDGKSSRQTDPLLLATSRADLAVSAGLVQWASETQLQISGKRLRELTLSVPSRLHATSVESPDIADWTQSAPADGESRNEIRVRFRNPISGTRTIRLYGEMSLGSEAFWNVPNLVVTNADSHSGNIAVRFPSRDSIRVDEFAGLQQSGAATESSPVKFIPVTTGDRRDRLASRRLAFNFWRQDYELVLVVPRNLQADTADSATLLRVNRDNVALDFRAATRFRQRPDHLRFSLPAGWTLQSVQIDGRNARWSARPVEADVQHINIAVPALTADNDARSPGMQLQVEAVRHLEIPDDPKTAAELQIPELRLADARMQLGTVSVRTAEPVELHASELKGLNLAPPKPADLLAFRYVARGNDRPAITGTLAIRQRPAALTVRSRSRLWLEQFHQKSQHKLSLTPRGVGYESFEIRVPADAGDSATFELHGNAAKLLSSVPGKPNGDFRTWTLRFDRPLRDTATLVVGLDSPRPEPPNAAVIGHRVQVVQATSHTGVIAIEADENKQLAVTAISQAGGPGKKKAKPVPLEEISPAEFDRTARGLVAAYRFLSPDYQVTLIETAMPTLKTAAVTCRQQRLESIISNTGEIQNRITLDLNVAGVSDIRLQLPDGAVMWAALRDGKPVELRRVGTTIVIPLGSASTSSSRVVEMVYQTRVDTLENLGRIRQTAPTVSFISADSRSVPIEIREREWTVYHAADLAVLRSTGEFQAADSMDRASWLTAAFSPVPDPTGLSLPQKLGLLAGLLALVTLFGLSYRRYGSHGVVGTFAVLAVVGVIVLSLTTPVMHQARMSARESTKEAAKTEAMQLDSSHDVRQTFDQIVKGNYEGDDEPVPKKSPFKEPFATGEPAKTASKPRNELVNGKRNPPEVPAVVDSTAGSTRQPNRARLSVAVEFTPPSDAETKTFRYVGAETEMPLGIDLTYETRRGGLMLRCCLIVGVSLLFWWLRNRSVALRGRLAFVGVVAPAVLFGWAPIDWQPYLDGVFLGTLAGCALWGLQRVVLNTIRQIRARNAATSPEWLANHSATGLITAVAISLCGTHASFADDAVTEPAKPVGFVSAAKYDIELKDRDAKNSKSAVIKALFTLHNLGNKAMPISVPLGRVAITSGTLDGKPASLFWRKTAGDAETLSVLVPGSGRHELQLSFTIPLSKSANGADVTLPVRPVASGRVLLKHASKDERVLVTGLQGTVRETRKDEKSVIEFPVDTARDLTIQLRPRTMATTISAAVTVGETTSEIDITDHGVRQRDRFTLQVRQGAISEWTFRLPAERKLIGISGPDVAGWSLTEAESGERTARVQFNKPVTKSTAVTFELMQPQSFTDESTDVTFRRVVPENLSPPNSTVTVFSGRQFAVRAVTATNTRSLEIPRSKLTGRLTRFRYRTTQPDAALTFGVMRRKPQTEIAAEHAVVVDREEIRVSSRLTVDLKGFPRTKLTMFLPEGFTLQNVRGDHGAEWSLGEDATMLIVLFPKPQTGVVRIALQGFLRRDEKSETADIALPAPMMTNKLRTVVGIWGSPGMSVSPKLSDGWQTLTAGQLPGDVLGRVTGLPAVAFRSQQLETSLLSVKVSPKQSDIQAVALTKITATNATVQYTTLMKWSGLTGLSRRIAVTAPEWLGKDLTFQSGQPTRIARSAGGEAQGRSRWIISNFERSRREIALVATATLPITPATANKLTAPLFTFEHVDLQAAGNEGQPETFKPVARVQQFVVVANHSNSRIVPAVSSPHRTIAERELPEWNPSADDGGAFSASIVDRILVKDNADEPTWTVRRTVKRLGVAAAVNRAELTTLLEIDGTWRMRAVYHMKNRNRRFLALKLPESARLNHVSVAGQRVTVSQKYNDAVTWHLVPLLRTIGSDDGFTVQIVLSGKLPDGALSRSLRIAGTRLDLPAPQVVSLEDDSAWGIPVEETVWRVRLPSGFSASADTDQDSTNLTPISEPSAVAVTRSGGKTTRDFDEATLQQLLQQRAADFLRKCTRPTHPNVEQPSFAFPLRDDGVIGRTDQPVQRTSFRTIRNEGTNGAQKSTPVIVPSFGHTRTRSQDTDTATSDFDLPEAADGVVLTFRKTGGGPRLALTVRPETVSQSGWQFAWAAGWLVFGVIGWRIVRRDDATDRLLRLLPLASFGFGTLAFLSLTGVASVIGLIVAILGAAWTAVEFCRQSAQRT